MRLIHTTRLDLRTFFDTHVPSYAILSHTWGDDEVDCQTFASRERTNSEGWRKIEQCCQLAHAQGLDWAWVDTCCIDKTSSAELSEAINSMYRWYEHAVVCYAFLSDYDLNTDGTPGTGLSACRWFTRGWTLQELLAPKEVAFYDQKLDFVGTRTSLTSELAAITHINVDYLSSRTPFRWACVAERMFWASRRQTTRIEDQAYCLLGIFDVNMPLLYGEGQRAFKRLQEQIIVQSSDESIFAWMVIDSHMDTRGMLAESVAEFANSGGLLSVEAPPVRPPSTFTNQGLEFAVPMHSSRKLADWFVPSPVLRLEVALACQRLGGPLKHKRLAVSLVRESQNEWLWRRVVTSEHHTSSVPPLFHSFVAVCAGYNKINIASHRIANTGTRRHDDCSGPVSTILNLVLLFWGLAVVVLAVQYPHDPENDMHASLAMIYQFVVLMWYWSIYKHNFWSLVLLSLPVAWAGFQHIGRLVGTLFMISFFHVLREHRRR